MSSKQNKLDNYFKIDKSVKKISKGKLSMSQIIKEKYWKIPLRTRDMNGKGFNIDTWKLQKTPDILKCSSLPKGKGYGTKGYDYQSILGMEFKRPNSKHIENFKNSNYGVLTGDKNKIVVIDIDIDKFTDNSNDFIVFCNEKLGLVADDDYKISVENIVKKINTYSVKTASGGFHLYFKSDDAGEYSNSTDKPRGLDTRGEGGYVVGADSRIVKPLENGKLEWLEYKQYIGSPIAELTDFNLELFKIVQAKFNKTEQEIVKTGFRGKQNSSGGFSGKLYQYEISDELLDLIESKIPDEFWDYDNWLKLTTFYKMINGYDNPHIKKRWDKICKKQRNYNQVQNYKIWNGVRAIPFIPDVILNNCELSYLIPYVKYKPLTKNKISGDITDNKRYITEFLYDENMEYIGKPFENLVIRSGTGTGKTEFTRKYHQETIGTEYRFVSIVSRRSLADEHYRVFDGKKPDDRTYIHYEHVKKLKNHQDDDLIICIDSLRKIENWDFSNKIIFLDEFNSVFEHLMDSDTIKRNRRLVLRLFKHILKTAKQVICVDADITDRALMFLNTKYWDNPPASFESANIDFKYIVNTHQAYKGTESEELTSNQELIKKLRESPKFMCCCDSKTQAEHLTELLNNKNCEITSCDQLKCTCKQLPHEFDKVVCIVRDYEGDMNLDNHKRVIFSPKILYGLDSVMPRPVFCIYMEHTITSNKMLQQIARCRNIEKLWYYFPNKLQHCNSYKFNTQSDVLKLMNCLDKKTKDLLQETIMHDENDYITLDKIIEKSTISDDAYSSFYVDLLKGIIYDDDCDRANMFWNFKMRLQQAGYCDKIIYIKQLALNSDNERELRIELKNQRTDNFIKLLELSIDLMKKPKLTDNQMKINKILNLNIPQMIEYSEIFTETYKFTQYLNWVNLFENFEMCVKDKVIQKLREDFAPQVARSSLNKIRFIRKTLKQLKPETGCLTGTEMVDNPDEWQSEYNLIFNRKSKKKIVDQFGIGSILKTEIVNLIGFNPYIAERVEIHIDGERLFRKAYSLHLDHKTWLWNKKLYNIGKQIEQAKYKFIEDMLDV
jgi:hypothetical protein